MGPADVVVHGVNLEEAIHCVCVMRGSAKGSFDIIDIQIHTISEL